MKHHFSDLLDRADDYRTIVPNRERYAYVADDVIEDKEWVKIITINKHHRNWQQIFDCPNLEELTLHDPSKEQLQDLHKLRCLKRLRVSLFRAKDIEFISFLYNLEEVVFEYVSGFSDLSPFNKLAKLKSLHFENLRSVSNFDGLRGLDILKYLHIDGTIDWNQPIDNFEFLKGLSNLEVFSLRFVITKAEFPALLPIVHLNKLKKIKIGRATFKTNEYALLEAALPKVEGCSWDLCWDYQNNFEFLGKRAGYVRKNSPIAKERCAEFTAMFEEMKSAAGKIIKGPQR